MNTKHEKNQSNSSIPISVRLPSDVYRELEAQRKLANLSMSVFVRETILKNKVHVNARPIPREETRIAHYKLQKSFDFIDSLAKFAQKGHAVDHLENDVYKALILDLKKLQDLMLSQIKEISNDC